MVLFLFPETEDSDDLPLEDDLPDLPVVFTLRVLRRYDFLTPSDLLRPVFLNDFGLEDFNLLLLSSDDSDV